MHKDLNSSSFDSEIASGVTLVDFFANWCGPCKMLGPVIDELGDDYEGKVSVCKVDVDKYPELANRFYISSIPCVIIFKDGEVKHKLIGFRMKSQIAEYLDAEL